MRTQDRGGRPSPSCTPSGSYAAVRCTTVCAGSWYAHLEATSRGYTPAEPRRVRPQTEACPTGRTAGRGSAPLRRRCPTSSSSSAGQEGPRARGDPRLGGPTCPAPEQPRARPEPAPRAGSRRSGRASGRTSGRPSSRVQEHFRADPRPEQPSDPKRAPRRRPAATSATGLRAELLTSPNPTAARCVPPTSARAPRCTEGGPPGYSCAFGTRPRGRVPAQARRRGRREARGRRAQPGAVPRALPHRARTALRASSAEDDAQRPAPQRCGVLSHAGREGARTEGQGDVPAAGAGAARPRVARRPDVERRPATPARRRRHPGRERAQSAGDPDEGRAPPGARRRTKRRGARFTRSTRRTANGRWSSTSARCTTRCRQRRCGASRRPSRLRAAAKRGGSGRRRGARRRRCSLRNKGRAGGKGGRWAPGAGGSRPSRDARRAAAGRGGGGGADGAAAFGTGAAGAPRMPLPPPPPSPRTGRFFPPTARPSRRRRPSRGRAAAARPHHGQRHAAARVDASDGGRRAADGGRRAAEKWRARPGDVRSFVGGLRRRQSGPVPRPERVQGSLASSPPSRVSSRRPSPPNCLYLRVDPCRHVFPRFLLVGHASAQGRAPAVGATASGSTRSPLEGLPVAAAAAVAAQIPFGLPEELLLPLRARRATIGLGHASARSRSSSVCSRSARRPHLRRLGLVQVLARLGLGLGHTLLHKLELALNEAHAHGGDARSKHWKV